MRLLVVFLLLVTSAACQRRQPAALILATTTSVVNSGLTEQLLPEYQRQSRADVRTVPVGSGRALKMLAAMQADVAITHAPAQETDALRAHPTWHYRKILYNQFVIVGPPEDPAGANGLPAVDAMRRIATSSARFISRGDESGTHERERQLWRAAGATPPAPRLVIAGAGMGETMRIASETGSYTLVDEGTLAQLAAAVNLRVVSSGDPLLLNTYAVITDPANAPGMAFARWLAEGDGRGLVVERLRRGTLRGFTVWPAGTRGTAPADEPALRIAAPDS